MFSTPRGTAPSSKGKSSRRSVPVALIDLADRPGDDMIDRAGVDSLAGAIYMTGTVTAVGKRRDVNRLRDHAPRSTRPHMSCRFNRPSWREPIPNRRETAIGTGDVDGRTVRLAEQCGVH
ncbi:hypothetical protein GONAM_02_02760 [Gordonia namibiensis NBRC 108229]|uniref:Uncharacterized protein n=1 Tax=Gordonia namibiensis NBRC 108229 TaxID=1208314 RepID=K6X314_9ACTN|nr:hypothetical protein GONAM_02_02760 [Gordonia namibiensis NBRC 108229]